MTLLDLAKSKQKSKEKSLEITGFSGAMLFQERLHEMGLHIGMKIHLIGRAPFGGPLLIRFNTSFLALRNEEAQCALVKVCGA